MIREFSAELYRSRSSTRSGWPTSRITTATHRPFLIAQAQVEAMAIITADCAFAAYDVQLIAVR
jgi:hypothetical protein